ncbi:hypothetical protein DL93DRAFT_2174357 [Clavulina sp. PMI_390]|nr:hypothetical protein DL93DRAFT_2174357 [Clavulina sp. PMI_390]
MPEVPSNSLMPVSVLTVAIGTLVQANLSGVLPPAAVVTKPKGKLVKPSALKRPIPSGSGGSQRKAKKTKLDSLTDSIDGQIPLADVPSGGRTYSTTSHTIRRNRNAEAWAQVLPHLALPLITVKKAFDSNDTLPSQHPAIKCIRECILLHSEVCVISFGCIRDITIQYCECVSAAQAIILHGAFPSTPTRASTLVFDIRFLEFVRLVTLFSGPNIGALANATYGFLKWSGVTGVSEATLPKLLSTSLEKYQLTQGRIKQLINTLRHPPSESSPVLPLTEDEQTTQSEAQPSSTAAPQTTTIDSIPSAQNVLPPITSEMVKEALAGNPFNGIIGSPLEWKKPTGIAPSPCLQQLCPNCFHPSV